MPTVQHVRKDEHEGPGRFLKERIDGVVRSERRIRQAQTLGRAIFLGGLVSLYGVPLGTEVVLGLGLSVAGLGAALLGRLGPPAPTPLQCAQVMDRRLGLGERLSTALERVLSSRDPQSEGESVARLLAREADRALVACGEWGWRRSPRPREAAAGAALLLIALFLAHWSPPPVQRDEIPVPVAAGTASGADPLVPPIRTMPEGSSTPETPSVTPTPTLDRRRPISSAPRRVSKPEREGNPLFEEARRRPGRLFRKSIPSLFGPGKPARIEARVTKSLPGPGDVPGASGAAHPAHQNPTSADRFHSYQRLAEETLESNGLGREERAIVRRYFEALRPR